MQWNLLGFFVGRTNNETEIRLSSSTLSFIDKIYVRQFMMTWIEFELSRRFHLFIYLSSETVCAQSFEQRVGTIYAANCVHGFSKIQSNIWISHINCIFRSQELELIFLLSLVHACQTHTIIFIRAGSEIHPAVEIPCACSTKRSIKSTASQLASSSSTYILQKKKKIAYIFYGIVWVQFFLSFFCQSFAYEMIKFSGGFFKAG